MEFRKLIFDIDDTIYDYSCAHKTALSQVFELCGQLGISDDCIEEYFKSSRAHVHMQLLGSGSSHNRLLYFQGLLERAGKFSSTNALDLYNTYWDTFLSHINIFNGAIELLEKLKSKSIEMCLLTDLTAHIQFRKIKKMGLDTYFKYIVTSEEAGHEKPHPFMFQCALNKLEAERNDVVMIGDSFDKDILGAHNFGIRSIWFNRGQKEKEIPSSAVEVIEFAQLNSLLL